MKKSELIAKLSAIPGDPEVALFDHRMNLDNDYGDGSSEGIYNEFGVELINAELDPQDFEDMDTPMPKPFIGLTFENPDYEHILAKCRVCGCTDEDCRQCVEKTGKICHWIEPDLCSACQEDK